MTCHLSTSNYPLLGLFQHVPPMPKFGDSISEPLVPLSFQVCPTPSVWWVWVPAQAQNLYFLSRCWSSSIVRLKPQVSTWQSHGWRGEICEFPHGPLKKMPIRGKSWIPHGSFNITIVSIPYIWYLTKLHVLLIVLHIHLQLTVWLKQCHKPPMTGTGLYNLFMVITRGWFMALFYQHDTCFVTHFTFLLWMVAKSGITDGWNPIPSGND